MSVTHKAIQTIDFESEGKEWYLDVEFTGNIDIDNDTIDYEGGTDKKPDYLVVDGNATWNEKKHNKSENKIIHTWFHGGGWEKVNDTLIYSYEKQCKE